MTMSEQDFLRDYGQPMYPIVAFERVGHVIKGKVISVPRGEQVTIDGDTQPVLKVALEVLDGTTIPCGKAGERRDAKPGEFVSLWIKPGGMAGSYQHALNEANAQGLQPGGTFAMQYTGDGPKSPGRTAPKQYKAIYRAPAIVVSTDELMPSAQTATAPSDEPAAAVAAPSLDDLF